MIVVCVGGPHDGREMDVPDDAVRLEFLDDSAEYQVVQPAGVNPTALYVA
jgi:hypothetical protein